ncbi:MAG: fatty acid desaturase [Salinarimonas sp.]
MSDAIASADSQLWQLKDSRFERYSFEGDINRRLAALRPDDYTGLLYILKDYAVIIGCALIVTNVSWWLYPLAVILIGAHQRGLTTISHDAAHRILARTTWWNYFLGITFAAYPLFQRHYSYRISHVYRHHPHLGDPSKDPDLKFFLQTGVYEVQHPTRYFFNIVVLPILGGATLDYLKYIWENRFKISEHPDSHLDIRKIRLDTIGFFAFWGLVIGASVYFGLFLELLLFWVIPYLTVFQVLGWFIEIAEHSPMCESENKNIYLTRNRKGNWLERILFGVNLDEYHLEHHLSPGIPFWHLHRAQQIRVQDPEYAKVAQSWGGLFVPGPQGQRSVIGQLMDRNDRLYFERRYGCTAQVRS